MQNRSGRSLCFLLSATEDVEETCSGVLDGTVKGLCPIRLALGGVVLREGAVEFGRCGGELGAHVAGDDGKASDGYNNREGPFDGESVYIWCEFGVLYGAYLG